jgi:TATA-box binding protein (TBP) (component of TFIID and TFIIIB)
MSKINLDLIKQTDVLPDGLKISTITITCRFDTLFYINNIGKYLNLSNNKILSVKYKKANGDGCTRSSVRIKQKKKKEKKNKKVKSKKKKIKKIFYNQATVKINTKGKIKPTNIKLFKNGSIQMTGCNSIENAIESMKILCSEVCKIRGVFNKKMTKIKDIKFTENISNVTVDQILDFKVGMINSNFDIGFHIDRDIFYEIMLGESTECSYEPCVHACVNIKYNYKDIKDISVFVFESGSVIITGAREKSQIVAAYKYIVKKLCSNYNIIVQKDIKCLLKRKDVEHLVSNSSSNSCPDYKFVVQKDINSLLCQQNKLIY